MYGIAYYHMNMAINKIKKSNCCIRHTCTKEIQIKSYLNITTLDSNTIASDAC